MKKLSLTSVIVTLGLSATSTFASFYDPRDWRDGRHHSNRDRDDDAEIRFRVPGFSLNIDTNDNRSVYSRRECHGLVDRGYFTSVDDCLRNNIRNY